MLYGSHDPVFLYVVFVFFSLYMVSLSLAMLNLSFLDALVYPLAASISLRNFLIMPHEPGVTFCFDEFIRVTFAFKGKFIALFSLVPPDGPAVRLKMVIFWFIWMLSYFDALVYPLVSSISLRNFIIMVHEPGVPFWLDEVIRNIFIFKGFVIAFFILVPPDGPVLLLFMMSFNGNSFLPIFLLVNLSYLDTLINPLVASPSVRNFIIMHHKSCVPFC